MMMNRRGRRRGLKRFTDGVVGEHRACVVSPAVRAHFGTGIKNAAWRGSKSLIEDWKGRERNAGLRHEKEPLVEGVLVERVLYKRHLGFDDTETPPDGRYTKCRRKSIIVKETLSKRAVGRTGMIIDRVERRRGIEVKKRAPDVFKRHRAAREKQKGDLGWWISSLCAGRRLLPRQ